MRRSFIHNIAFYTAFKYIYLCQTWCERRDAGACEHNENRWWRACVAFNRRWVLYGLHGHNFKLSTYHWSTSMCNLNMYFLYIDYNLWLNVKVSQLELPILVKKIYCASLNSTFWTDMKYRIRRKLACLLDICLVNTIELDRVSSYQVLRITSSSN